MSSIVQNGVIQQLSVSQAEKFDPRQVGGCPTKWWLESVRDQKPDQHAAQAAGESGHGLFAHYFKHGELPAGRAGTKAAGLTGKLRKTVDYAIIKGDLPKPGPDMLVEWRGDGQEKFSKHTCACGHPLMQHGPTPLRKMICAECDCSEPTPMWIPLLKAKTLWLGGIPWEIFIDLAFLRDGIPTVIDHKFSADPEVYAKPDGEIINTIQMPVYALALVHAGVFPAAPLWNLFHNYNRKTSGLQFFRGGEFSWDQILERKRDIEERVIPQMKQVAQATDQRDVPFNRRACEAWNGCPHQSICHAYKENKMALSDEEMKLFDDIAPAAGSAPAAELDDEAKLEAEFAAKKAKMAADKAAKAKFEAEAAAKRQADAEAAAKPKAKPLIVDNTGGVLPPDAPKSRPELASEQAKPDAKAKKTAGGPATVTVTVDLETFDKIRPLLGK